MTASSPLRIAVLIDHVESDYHLEIIAGVLRATRAAQVRTLVVAGGWLGTPEKPVTRNFLYGLLRRARVDGYVLLTGSLSNYSGLPRFSEWLRGFSDVPSVSIGLELGAMPAVCVDNEQGLYEVVSHLIEKHGRNRIAMLKGPADGIEAEARLRAYTRALTDHRLPIDERLIVSAGLGRSTGMAATSQLLEQLRLTPGGLDAIVGVNDDVAQGALEELKRRDVRVPEQVAVVGFDDSSSSGSTNPPLTTVNQHVERQGHAAAQRLIDALVSGKAPASEVLRPTLVVRASCGCTMPVVNDSRGIGRAQRTGSSCLSALNEKKLGIAAELLRAASGRMVQAAGWEARLLEALLLDLVTPEGSKLVRAFELIGRRQAGAGADLLACHDVLTTLRLQALSCTVSDREARPRLEDLFQEARLALARMGVDVERHRHGVLSLRLRIITKACEALLGAGDLQSLGRTLEEQLPGLGIESFAISRFENDSARTLLPFARSSHGLWHPQNASLPVETLGLDPVLEQEDVVIVEPLEIDGTPLGIAALGWGAETPAHYEQLRELLSSALVIARASALVPVVVGAAGERPTRPAASLPAYSESVAPITMLSGDTLAPRR
jgi:DNA-binding LacI/PurR family transcriptional regulator